MELQSVYEFTDPAEYLREVFRKKQELNSKYSLRAWARQIGLKNHVLLSLILNGKRHLTPQVAMQIRKGMPLNSSERRYFDLLVLLKSAKDDDLRLLFQGELENLHPRKEFSVVQLDQFRFISDWRHVCIWQMVQLKEFKNDPVWIARRLGHGVSPGEVERVLRRLIRLKLVEKDAHGKLLHKLPFWGTTNDVPSGMIRRVHQQFLDLAKKALEQQSVSEREVSTYTLCIRKSELPEAKEMIREFRRKFGLRFDSAEGDETYVLAAQFFRVTETGEKK